MGSGPVRGFSITLGIGILTSVFTAIFVTRLLVIMWFERVAENVGGLKMRKLVLRKQVLISFQRLGFGLGSHCLFGSVAWLCSHTRPKLRYRFSWRHKHPDTEYEDVDVGVYRDALSTLDLGDVSISQVFDPNFAEDQHVARSVFSNRLAMMYR